MWHTDISGIVRGQRILKGGKKCDVLYLSSRGIRTRVDRKVQDNMI